MNKKKIKIIVSILIIVLLIGLGIFGYKKIKNRNNGSKVIENNNNLKAVDSLIDAGYTSFNSIKINNEKKYVYLIYKVYAKQNFDSENNPKTVILPCKNSSNKYVNQNIDTYDLIYNMYVAITDKLASSASVNNLEKKRLLSSWTIKDYANCDGIDSDTSTSFIKSAVSIKSSYNNKNIYQIKDEYFYITFNHDFEFDTTDKIYKINKDAFKYYKIFNIKTGEMIYEIPTNNLEIFNPQNYNIPKNQSGKIKIYYQSTNGGRITIGSTNSENVFQDKIAIYNNNLYYLETNYNKKDEKGRVKLDVHEVIFGDNVDPENPNNKYKDKILSSDEVYDVYADVSLNGES